MAEIDNNNQEIISDNEIKEVVETEQKEVVENEAKEKSAPSIEELTAQLAKVQADANRYKKSIDKLTHENAEYKRKERERMSEEERLAKEREEEEEKMKEKLASLEDFKKRSEAKNRYLSQGMDSDLADKAVDAEVNADWNALSAIQKQFTEASIKKAQDAWLKDAPKIKQKDDSEGGENDVFWNAFGMRPKR